MKAVVSREGGKIVPIMVIVAEEEGGLLSLNKFFELSLLSACNELCVKIIVQIYNTNMAYYCSLYTTTVM